jgi:penicillin-binding protein 2
MVTHSARQKQKQQGGIDRTLLRLAVLGIMIVAAFVALFSRLWFLQVLASDQYRDLARENRVRQIQSEPPRGRILDRNGKVLIDNRLTSAVTVERAVLNNPYKRRRVFQRLSRLLGVKVSEMRNRLKDTTLSPYKPVAVAKDVPRGARDYILENLEDFPGVEIEKLPIRDFPRGPLAAHVLGYIREITAEQLKSDHFKKVRRKYQAGDIVGQSGIEYQYDRFLRGVPRMEKVVVNSAGNPLVNRVKQQEEPGDDLMLWLDTEIQRSTERALQSGIEAARGAGYQAVGGAVVVMEPSTGGVVGMASYPTYDPTILADGITQKEYDALGAKTPNDPNDDALFNRAIQGERAPGSSFKPVTAGAAMATGVVDPYTAIQCPGSAVYPPDNPPGAVEFRNWTSASFGSIGFPTSLEISCDTFYYELGWRMETAFGPPESAGGDGSERFQKYMRRAGFGRETGVDLPNEAEGRVADAEWLDEFCKEVECLDEDWLPGYTINMSIGQGDLVVTPMQMAVTYSALVNGGRVLEPRLAKEVQVTDEGGKTRTIRELRAPVAAKLPLDDTQVSVIREGLELVTAGDNGTAQSSFAGFPLDKYPIAGKTGTAELGDTDLNDAWFVSYGPADSPDYVIAVYLERAGHGGESAAPVARQIWEDIYNVDEETDIQLGFDQSG